MINCSPIWIILPVNIQYWIILPNAVDTNHIEETCCCCSSRLCQSRDLNSLRRLKITSSGLYWLGPIYSAKDKEYIVVAVHGQETGRETCLRLHVKHINDTNNFWLADLVGGPDAALGFLRIFSCRTGD